MYDIDFSDNLPLEKKDYFGWEVNRLSKPSAKSDSDAYELISRQRAMISRNIIGELDEERAFDLYFYGHYGLPINYALRISKNVNPTFNIILTLDRAKRSINIIRNRYNLQTKESISQLMNLRELRAKENKMILELIHNNFGNYSKAFRMAIDDIIEEYAPRFTKSDYLYRILNVKNSAYSAPSDIPNPQLRKIIPGDIIMDRALWSSAIRAETTIFRYSYKGQSVTHALAANHEEVLFIIENNEHLKAIDISGYKFSKKDEGLTSGEMLIKSHTTFKVIGIQKSNPRLDRRIVILEPVSVDSLKLGDVLKNPYDGNPYDPTTLPFPSLVAPSPSPETDPTAEATTSTLAAEAELGAVGGVSESFLPELK